MPARKNRPNKHAAKLDSEDKRVLVIFGYHEQMKSVREPHMRTPVTMGPSTGTLHHYDGFNNGLSATVKGLTTRGYLVCDGPEIEFGDMRRDRDVGGEKFLVYRLTEMGKQAYDALCIEDPSAWRPASPDRALGRMGLDEHGWPEDPAAIRFESAMSELASDTCIECGVRRGRHAGGCPTRNIPVGNLDDWAGAERAWKAEAKAAAAYERSCYPSDQIYFEELEASKRQS